MVNARSLSYRNGLGGDYARSTPAARKRSALPAIGIEVAARKSFKLRQIRPASLFGKGQVEEIAGLADEHEARLLVVDAALTPVQQKTLEEDTGCKVIDRTGLILEIFGERAATAEGRLQVELAHLDYQAGRLVRAGPTLSGSGGFGFLGGPGETQIEADRRQIRDRMARIRRELDQVRRTRGPAAGANAPWPVIALVGYTNRQIDPVQPHDPSRGGGRGLAVRDARPDHAQREDPGFRPGDPVGHRRICLQPADRAGRRLSRDAGGSGRLRPHPPCPRHRPPDSEAQAADVEAVLSSLGLAEEGSPPRLEVWKA